MNKILIIIFLLFFSACNFQKSYAQEEMYFQVIIDLEMEGDKLPYSDEAILKLPKSYSRSGVPTRLVYCAHGAGGGVENEKWFLNQFGLIDTLLANGYACFDVNGGKNVENMGGRWVVESAYKAYQYIRENYNIYDEIFVIGLSMGGLSSTNFVYRYPDIVRAHAMFSPVLSLKDQAWDNPWFSSTRKSIAEAFQFEDNSGTTWENDKVIGWDPLYTDTFQTKPDTFKNYPVPAKIWHGTSDQLVKIDASRSFQRFIKNANGYCELRELDGEDHRLSVGNPFINNELILFFRKFDN